YCAVRRRTSAFNCSCCAGVNFSAPRAPYVPFAGPPKEMHCLLLPGQSLGNCNRPLCTSISRAELRSYWPKKDPSSMREASHRQMVDIWLIPAAASPGMSGCSKTSELVSNLLSAPETRWSPRTEVQLE